MSGKRQTLWSNDAEQTEAGVAGRPPRTSRGGAAAVQNITLARNSPVMTETEVATSPGIMNE